jgi:Bacterial HORMA domain family 1
MTTYTNTETYTRVDVAKVFENFEADLCLIARTSGLWEVDFARRVAADVAVYADHEYLTEVHVVLANTVRQPVRVHEYKVSTNASGWIVERPDGNVWPSTPGGSLQVVLKWSTAWTALNAAAQTLFKNGLKVSWGTTDVDTTYPGLNATTTRAYASNAFGLARTTREKQ